MILISLKSQKITKKYVELVYKYFSRILLKLYVITTDIFKIFKFPLPKIACIHSFPMLITTPYLDWPIHHLEQGNEVGSQSQSRVLCEPGAFWITVNMLCYCAVVPILTYLLTSLYLEGVNWKRKVITDFLKLENCGS